MGLKESGLRGSLRNVSVGIDAIPDSVVDNFEDADAEPPGVYETGEGIDDYYTIVNGDFARTTSDVVEGGHAIERTSASGPDAIISTSADGLNSYPEGGDTVLFLVRNTSGEADPGLLAQAEDKGGGDFDGYGFGLIDGGLRLRRYDNSDLTNIAAPNNGDITTGEWYWCEADLPESGDDTIEMRLYEVDTESLEPGDHIETASGTDDTYVGNDGIGVFCHSGSGTGTVLDFIRIDE